MDIIIVVVIGLLMGYIGKCAPGACKIEHFLGGNFHINNYIENNTWMFGNMKFSSSVDQDISRESDRVRYPLQYEK